eukprot:CAMPEP_0113590334 /NCGR_PEP_ID=MMETSP0015_2-20120614/36619_1 /TAXON_ID=2838 /ORGANISM="Odontella" /LENGTH=478 /DNA_ID=CAMNT_0000496519 /DNA_START=386 /DNA_END=1822 /DNA_ORIENTATION=- /assembly_acc=CAM_ASM_000160
MTPDSASPKGRARPTPPGPASARKLASAAFLSALLLLFLPGGVSSFSTAVEPARSPAQTAGDNDFIRHPLQRQPAESLLNLAFRNSVKRPGSEAHRRSWDRFSSLALDTIRDDLARRLEAHSIAEDDDATDALSFALGVAADRGEMPSFADGGARAGYALRYFCRARLLADILFAGRMRHLRRREPVSGVAAGLKDESGGAGMADADFAGCVTDLLRGGAGAECRVGSLGGGPGFDFVALAVSAAHDALEREGHGLRSASEGADAPRAAAASDFVLPRDTYTVVHATVYEYEGGWGELVPHMERAARSALGGGHTCSFAGCDITLPLVHAANVACRENVRATDMWICSYCVAENAVRLRENNFVFFRQLFDAAQDGALFVFTETTHRLWPELIEAAVKMERVDFDAGRVAGFDVSFPRIDRGRGKTGHQLALRKRPGARLEPGVAEMCDRFARDREVHERKIAKGYSRQRPKVKGAKE